MADHEKGDRLSGRPPQISAWQHRKYSPRLNREQALFKVRQHQAAALRLAKAAVGEVASVALPLIHLAGFHVQQAKALSRAVGGMRA